MFGKVLDWFGGFGFKKNRKEDEPESFWSVIGAAAPLGAQQRYSGLRDGLSDLEIGLQRHLLGLQRHSQGCSPF